MQQMKGKITPVIAVTSKLMTTGVDSKTCKLVVLDANIQSMTEFKQIIDEALVFALISAKNFFTILDFRGVTRLFADPAFDGEPVVILDVPENKPLVEQPLPKPSDKDIIKTRAKAI
ncbi:Uncharacterised protein [Mannheimia haemolytica]|uniref:Uncharacterized protein n=1 Tax=Mannheimia haemolytica TaxID=75985 RepID=A0A378MTS2_MANHA|nr:Uncharacterised protein [Mannheimia haemolytica]